MGGEERPLEDILSRLNDLSRTPREVDLRDAPGASTLEPTVIIEAPAPAAPAPTPVSAPVAPASEPVSIAESTPPPVPIPAQPEVEPVIDLRAPQTVAPSEPPAPGGEPSPPTPSPSEAFTARGHARVAHAGSVETGSRYGRNGVVVPAAARTAAKPDTVPVLPVSVKNDAQAELEFGDSAASSPNWVRIAILLLLLVAAGAAVALVLL